MDKNLGKNKKIDSLNKQLSEMPVDVWTRSFLHPLTVCGSSRYVAPNPPLRQAAGRYVQFALKWLKIM